MTQPCPLTRKSGLRVFSACSLSFLLIMMPFVQVARASVRSSGAGSRESERGSSPTVREGSSATTNAAAENSLLNSPIPKPAPEPPALLAPAITATTTDAIVNDDLDTKADPTNGLASTEKIEYTVTITNTGTDATNVQFSVPSLDSRTTFVPGSISASPNARNDSFDVAGNIWITVPNDAAASGNSSGDLLNNDCDPDPTGGPCTNTGLTITTLGGDASAPFAGTSTQGGQVTATTGNGGFEYTPAPGYEGADSFTYTVTDSSGLTDTATVNITVAGMIWFIDANAGADGDGRLTSPFKFIGSFQAVNDGVGNHPKDNQTIFLYESGTSYTAPVTLRSGQKFIGQDSSASLSTLSGVTPPVFSAALPVVNSGNGVFVTIGSPAGGILLNANNLLRGFSLSGTAGTALQGTNFGTLNLTEVNVSSNAQALSLTTGTLSGPSAGTAAFGTVSSGGGTNGILLSGVAGTMTASGGTLTGTATGATFSVVGGTVSVTYSGNITQAANNAAVSISGGHTTGTITFQTGTINATNGTGLQFNNADSTTSYNFNGTTTLGGGDAGVDIMNGSSGTFSFGTGTSINNPSGIAYREDTITANVTYAGTITKTNNANNAVDINAKTGGTTTFNGAITASTTTANAIDLTSNGGGTINFNGTLTLTTSSGVAFNATGGGTVNAPRTDGTVSSAYVSNGGTGYTSPPTVTLSGGGGSGATAVAVGPGTIKSVNRILPGSNYTSPPTVTLTGGGGSGATAVATLGVNITLGSGGSGYTSTPTVNITGGGGTGATAIANVLGGAVVQVIVRNPGTGYTSAPTVTITGGGGSGATATANLGVAAVNVTNPGSGYTSAPTVGFSGGGGSGATATATVQTSVTSVNITAGGAGYTSAPSVAFIGGAGSGAAATSLLHGVSTLASLTGAALNVVSPTTIGASGLTFLSISSNGAASGIILNGTGANGLTVTGTSTTAGSGGTIQSTTSDGVALTNANNVVLGPTTINGSGRHGINVSGGSNLTLHGTQLTNSGDGDNEYGLNISNTTGTVTLSQATFDNAGDNLVYLTHTGALTFNVNNSSFSYPSSVSGTANSAILIEPSGSGASTASIQNSTFTNIVSASAQIGSNTLNANGTHNFTFSKNTINVTRGGRAGGVPVSGQELTTTNITIDNNVFTGAGGNGVISLDTNDGSIVKGTASNNIITSPPGVGMFVAVDEAGKSDVIVNGNLITNSGGDGIQTVNFGGTGVSTMDMTITNNQVNGHSLDRSVNFVGGIAAFALSAEPSAGDLVCAVMRGNTVTGTPASGTQCGGAPCDDYHLEEVAGAMTFEEVPNTGDTTLNAAYVNSINDPGPVSVFGFIDLTNGGTCNVTGLGMNLPIPSIPRVEGYILTAAASSTIDLNPFTENVLVQSTDAAHVDIARSEATAKASHEETIENGQTNRQANQPPSEATRHTLDLTNKNSEVGIERSHVRKHHAAAEEAGASQQVETRRQKAESSRAGVRSEESGVRAHHARSSKLGTRNSRVAAATPLGGGTVGPINLGTLAQNQTITITFQVTVDNPPNFAGVPPATPEVSNQGTVMFSEVGSPVLTDEVAGGAVTPTVTPVDLFDSLTTLTSDNNSADQGENITFTADVVIHPSQVPTPPALLTPTGTVTFKSDGVDIAGCVNVAMSQFAVGTGRATCTTSALTPPSRNITAVYSGDGNYDPSTSNTVAQTIIACVTNPVVDIATDEDDVDCVAGDCSLREAIKTVCNGNTITFNTAGAFNTPQTIMLTLGELSVARDVTINGPDAAGNHVTVSGGGVSRVFNINAGKTVTMRELTITGGNTGGPGGGILNDHGTLTLINMTVSGNTGAQGGGIYVDGDTTSASLTVINSTISGNSSFGSGAGIYVIGTGGAATLTMTNSTVSGNLTNSNSGGLHISNATATLTNVTVTNNRADIDNNGGVGGGILAASGTTTLHNTIVAGNFNDASPSTARDDVNGALDAASSFNLIGDGTGMTGITHGSNGNQVGTGVTPIDAMLGLLANNGGLTFTHALLPTSPAVETGSNTAATNAGLTTDQRGVGFPRNADSADANTTQTVDIGAFELHPSIEDITDKTTAEDTAVPQITFNLGDGTGALISTVTATSSNQTLVPDANILVGGAGSTRTLDISPAADANSPADGTATITVTVTATNGQTAVDTFVLTVTEVNDTPDAVNDTLTAMDEDSGLRIIPFTDLTGNDTKGAANESSQTLNVTAVSNPVGGTVVINGTNVEFTVAANFSGTASFDYQITDNGTTNTVSDPKSDTATASFAVNSINDPPSFTIAGNPPAVNEDAGAQTVNSFATSISQGAGGETGQTLTFNITPTGTTGNLSFSSGPAINSTTGALTYTTNADTNGTATFDVTLSDNGSNVPPNSNTSGTQSFTITVNAVDDAPTFQIASNPPAVNEDAGAQTVNSFATNFQPGPVTATDEGTQTLVGYTLTPTGTTGNLTFSSGPAIDNSGALTYTPTGDTSGTATFDAVATDTGSNTPPNVNQSAPVSFTITVNAANDAPVNTVPGAQGTSVNTPLTFSNGNGNQISVADADAGTNAIKVTLSVTNGTLTLNGTTGLDFSGTCSGAAGDGTADATMTFCGTLTDINNALNGMTYNPTAGFSGGADLTITSDDQGNTGGGAQTDTDMVNIQVATNLSINDAQVPEPASPNTVDMTFTVALNAPAGGAVSVNFQTNNGSATAGTCGTPGADYTTTNGTVNFAAGEQVKTINVPICSDNVADDGETFTVTLSSPSGANVIDGTATGTITANVAGTLLISELRTSGPGGAGDDFVEIYNNTNAPITVPAGGYGLFKMGSDCNATPVLIATIPAGRVIPARGHYLFTGPAYSLADYGGTSAATGDNLNEVPAQPLADIATDANIGLFATTDVTQISTVNRLDAVGFGVNVGGACNLLREGSTLPAIAGNATLEHSYFRKMCDWLQGQGCTVAGVPKDTNNNSADFWLADTAGSAATGRLGAPGPENLGSPLRRDNAGVNMFLLDGTVGPSAGANRARNGADPAGTFGSMTLRHRVTNNTGAPVTRLRYRVVDISTAIAPAGPTADLRALTSSIEPTVGPVHDPVTCTAGGAGAPPCSVVVQATTLETPPAQLIGGGYNSTLSSGTITTGTPLNNGNSILINFKLGVEKTGTFRFYIIVEALP